MIPLPLFFFFFFFFPAGSVGLFVVAGSPLFGSDRAPPQPSNPSLGGVA